MYGDTPFLINWQSVCVQDLKSIQVYGCIYVCMEEEYFVYIYAVNEWLRR